MSPKYYRIPLDEAREIGAEILTVLHGLYSRAEICGSVRRRRPIVHDLDIVLIPQLFAFPDQTIMRLKARWPDLVILRKGPRLAGVTLYQGVNVDLYASEERFFGMHILRWTGSAEHNIMLARRAKTLGLKLAVSRGLMKGGAVIASKTEAEIFEALKMDYVPPEEREIPHALQEDPRAHQEDREANG